MGDGYYSASVQCITDLSTCCSSDQGPYRGNWHFPNGTRLVLNSVNIYHSRGPQTVYIWRRNNANSPTGIYRCNIPTNTVHQTVYQWRYVLQ